MVGIKIGGNVKSLKVHNNVAIGMDLLEVAKDAHIEDAEVWANFISTEEGLAILKSGKANGETPKTIAERMISAIGISANVTQVASFVIPLLSKL